VLVQVKNVAEMGAYVSLLEYQGIEGMILLSELSRRRIRSINKLISVGRKEVVVVLRVDKDKGYIDLSKRRVSSEDIAKLDEKYHKSKTVHSIVRHVSETCHVKMIDLYEGFVWDLYKKYGHAFEAFKLAVAEPERVFESYTIDEKVKSALLKNISRRLTPQTVRMRADIEVTCFAEAGIEAIKKALRAGEAVSVPDFQIHITLVAPPLYVMMATHLDKDYGLQLLNQACDIVRDTITAQEGAFLMKTAPRAVTERDDRMLTTLMDQLEAQNRETDGDDAEDS
jgi:translation initiation factor 2 subunit 1